MSVSEENKSSKYIYVAFLTAPTKVGKAIRYVTKNKYSHVVLSFDEDLRTMYSFARYNINAPLVAGFVEESALRYSYLSDGDIPVKICKIPLTPQQYKKVLDYICFIKLNSNQYIYNHLALAFAAMHKKVAVNNSFTCLEFVYSVLYNCGVENSIDINRYFTINDLENVLSRYVVYEGNLKKPSTIDDWGNDLFYRRKSMPKVITASIKQCGVLLKRSIIS